MAGHQHPDDFRHRAACRSVDPEVFFPTAVQGREVDRQVRIAKAVCNGCPVRTECLDWALTRLPDGIAGGMTEHERRQERTRRRGARRRRPAAERPAGGTRAEVTRAGRAALAAGMDVHEVAGTFLVSLRTAQRWARTATSGTRGRRRTEGSAGGHRAPLQISHTATQAGTRAEGNRA
ncbi:WhiB family transcriptional regulator [Pseudonocardia petroleophila]|uniref:WhiB family transcriptional regulator n=1 Tax=Pseudonocardia petroleophila TaxID=37331 RepID=UPI003CD09187